MRTTPARDNVYDFNALLHPVTVFDHPRDVVTDSTLSLYEKRAILASWASDATAIASCPSLRAPHGLKAPVHIDDIFEALCALDGNGRRNPPGGKLMQLRSTERIRLSSGRTQNGAPPKRDSLTSRPAPQAGYFLPSDELGNVLWFALG